MYLNYINIINEPNKIGRSFMSLGRENIIDPEKLDKKLIDEIEDNLGKKSKFSDLSIGEKLILYKIVKEKKAGEFSEGVMPIDIKVSDEEVDSDNKFYYFAKSVFIDGKELLDEEAIRIQKDNLIKNKIRELIREYGKEANFVKNVDVRNLTQEQLLKIIRQPVVVENKNTGESILVRDLDEVTFDNLNKILVLDSDAVVISGKSFFKKTDLDDVKMNEIFTEDDLDKLIEGYDLGQKLKSYTLSSRERMNIQRQIKSCYKRAILKSGFDSKAVINVGFELDREGYIDMHSVKIKKDYEEGKYSSREFKTASENAKTALVFCNPLRNLPATKYMMWNTITLTFDSQDL